ncbi:MAG: hypothetical protein E7516_05655 [Ruminococcaceae bacterium]|nr:hypothetical protein [Oscillospiraceae bacterium]
MNNKIKDISLDAISRFTGIFPLVLSMCVCAGMGTIAGVILACMAVLLSAGFEQKKMMPVFTSFLIAVFTLNMYGPSALSAAVIFCGILLIISAPAHKKLNEYFRSPAIPSAMLATALSVTVLFTTDYFGIGATGAIPKTMIESYLSLGFHPNWRGVLYGTIVMVIMITFPRKFKNACKILSAAFLGLIATVLLNLWLNPSDMITAIKEVGTFSFADYKDTFILPVTSQPSAVLNGIMCGFALYFTVFYSLSLISAGKKDYMLCGAANAALGFVTCGFIPSEINKKNYVSSFAAAILTGLVAFIFKDFIARIPVHSCAVVLIVGAWNSVKWSELKNVFKSVKGIVCLISVVLAYLFTGAVYGTLITVVISVLYVKIFSNKSNA